MNEKHRLSDNLAVRATDHGSQVFVTVPGDDRRNFRFEPITLDDDEMWALIEWFTDGVCPVCGTNINVGEIVCDSCFQEAFRYNATH